MTLSDPLIVSLGDALEEVGLNRRLASDLLTSLHRRELVLAPRLSCLSALPRDVRALFGGEDESNAAVAVNYLEDDELIEIGREALEDLVESGDWREMIAAHVSARPAVDESGYQVTCDHCGRTFATSLEDVLDDPWGRIDCPYCHATLEDPGIRP